MANTWCRLYQSVLWNHKLHSLPDRMYKLWVTCIAASIGNCGWLPDVDVLSFHSKWPKRKTQDGIDLMLRLKLLDLDQGRLRIHDWQTLQYESDSSTDRARKFRERREMQRCSNVIATLENVSVTDGATKQQRYPSVSVSVSENTNPEKKTKGMADQFVNFLEYWEKPEPISGKVFPCVDVDLGCQIWISLTDKAIITEKSLPDIFAGLDRWKRSAQWKKGMVHSVPSWLGWSKNGSAAAPRWNDRPEPAAPESEY